jgi:hypothetical protein
MGLRYSWDQYRYRQSSIIVSATFETVELTWHRIEEGFVEFCHRIITWSKEDAICQAC